MQAKQAGGALHYFNIYYTCCVTLNLPEQCPRRLELGVFRMTKPFNQTLRYLAHQKLAAISIKLLCSCSVPAKLTQTR